MVSERRHPSYAAAVSGTGESSHRSRSSTPIIQSPIRTGDQQRNSAPQRGGNTDDVENPLHLNSNESSNAILVSPPLAGSSNYGTWSIAMRVALEVKNKWGIVNGSIAEPDFSSSQYPAWRRCNLMICSWICRAVLPSIVQSIMHMEKAMDVWNDLKKRFEQRDAHRISILQRDIYDLKQGNLSVNEYYTKCRGLWEQMNEMRPLPICKCEPRCSCDLLDLIKEERETDQIIRFLQGLTDEYNTLKSNILVLDPLPDIHRVYVMTEKFERQLQIVNSTGLEIVHANAAQMNQQTSLNASDELAAAVHYINSRKNYNNAGNRVAKCTFCGMNGHTVEKCYKKHGYPPGWVQGFKSKGKQTIAASSTSANNLPSSEQVQQLISLLQNQREQNQTPTSAAVSLMPTFNKETHLSEGKFSFNTQINSIFLEQSTWILDSGATDHISCSLKLFDEYHMVNGTVVNLPNGNCIEVKHVGNIKLSNDLWLRNVLHIPSFQFNIVSVTKLLKDSSYNLIFESDQCVLQEKGGKKIGFAKQQRGLYLLNESPGSLKTDCIHFTMQCSVETWHQRLGHFPVNRMHHLHNFTDVPVHTNKTVACDVCHFAKHKRSPFHLSNTSTNVCFELLHMDI